MNKFIKYKIVFDMMCKKSKGGRNMKKYIIDITYILRTSINSFPYMKSSKIKRSNTEKKSDSQHKLSCLLGIYSFRYCITPIINKNYNNLSIWILSNLN